MHGHNTLTISNVLHHLPLTEVLLTDEDNLEQIKTLTCGTSSEVNTVMMLISLVVEKAML